MDRKEEIAYRAWDVYYNVLDERMGISQGRGQFWSHRFMKAFLKIADICLEFDWDVTDYVTRCFSLLESDLRYVTPKDFTSKDLIDLYRKFLDAYGDMVVASWAMQLKQLTELECRLIPDKYANEISILRDMNLCFESWFRVLYPLKFNDELYEIYGEQAWLALSVNPRLREFARTRCPKNVEELERRLGKLGNTTEVKVQ